ncbi:MAG: nucleotide sugar dehydrogenase [Actinomycetota bacterium]
MGVVGQGYVGLTLAAVAADAGFDVTGMDIDEPRIDGLSSGVLVVPGVNEQVFETGVNSGKLGFSSDPDSMIGTDIIVICVPTPVRDQTPDLSYVEHASHMVADRLSPGQLVILESTTYPGTTDELVRPILESSGLMAGRDFLLAYSPERIDPGNEEYDFRQIPRIVGGLSAESTGAASLFYGQIVDKVVQVGSCRAAELAKLLENTFRHVNVALVNEMAMLCHETGIDVWEVIHAAETKPFGFMPFKPGPGVGGHCIPLDPTYLAWQVRRDAGRHFRILEQAQDINTQMPRYVGSRIADALNDEGKSVRGADILVLGIAYKPDVGDVRESPALEVMIYLMKRGAQVTYHDPTISAVRVDDHLLYSVPLTRKAIAAADCVAILTPHSTYDLSWIAEHANVIFDSRNAYEDDRRPNVVRL